MRTRWLWVVVVVLLAIPSVGAMSAEPLATAHGEFWTDLHIFGQWYGMQFAFNVQDRGENERDNGSISMRIFDNWTGKLVAVVVSTDVQDVVYDADTGWISFSPILRVTRGDLPAVPIGVFQAYDDAPDEFKMLNIPLPIHKGNIVIRQR